MCSRWVGVAWVVGVGVLGDPGCCCCMLPVAWYPWTPSLAPEHLAWMVGAVTAAGGKRLLCTSSPLLCCTTL